MQYQKDGFLQSPHQKYGPFLLYYWCSCHMVPDLILYFMTTWRSPNIFSQDKKKKDFLKDSFISEVLVKIKEVLIFFFNLFQITCDGLFIFACLKLQEFCWRQKPYGIHVQEMLKWVINTRTTHLIRSTCIIYYHSH